MTYLNPFHKEATERKIREITESRKFLMTSQDAVNYMRRNLEEETGLRVSVVHQIGAYSKVDRDPRGRTIVYVNEIS